MTRLLLLISLTLFLLSGCGGGGSDTTATTVNAQSTQKAWVRAHLDDVYLWYNEIIDVAPANYATAPDYFDALLVKSHDRFSFSMPLEAAQNEFQEGLETGFGFRVAQTWGRLFILYVDPSSPAAAALTRGTEIIAINGQLPGALSTSYLNSALFPDQPGAAISLTYRRPGTSTHLITSLVATTFTSTPVGQPQLIPVAYGKTAGYLLFNEHTAAAEQGLINAMTYFKQQGINELVLDLRYNPGGYLGIAEEVASMIGGNAVQGKVFERLLFNAKHPELTNDPDNTYHFSALDSVGAQLPMLGLTRLFVLTGPGTCSASESIINGLQPYIPVIRVGWTTCGKPYGSSMAAYDNQAYFALQFEGVNADGTDYYTSGFAPTCWAYDDLNHPLGNTGESTLNAAIFYIANNYCPGLQSVSLPKAVPSVETAPLGEILPMGQKPGLKLR